MKSVKIVLLLVAVFLFSTVGAFAQAAPKIGYVDLSRLFDEYGKTKEYDKVLEEKHNVYQKERNEKIESLRAAQEKLALLKDEEKNKLQQDIEKQKADLLDFQRSKETDLKKQRDEKIREILLEIEKIVKAYAEKEKYTMILNDRVLIYDNGVGDITEAILKTLNDSYNTPKK